MVPRTADLGAPGHRGLATDPQVAGPSPRPILTDPVQRAGREVLHPCESGGQGEAGSWSRAVAVPMSALLSSNVPLLL